MDSNAKRFIRSLVINGQQNYIISDYTWWNKHVNDLEEWMEKNTVAGKETQEGMVLSFANEQEELMFMLKWR